VAQAYSLEQQNAARAHAGLCHASSLTKLSAAVWCYLLYWRCSPPFRLWPCHQAIDACDLTLPGVPSPLTGSVGRFFTAAHLFGYCTAADVGRLDSFLRRCRRLGYCEQSQPSIAELYSDIDDTFFSRIMFNSKHILQQFLHDRTTTYSLRSRNHSKVLVNKTSYLNDWDFLIRLLYKYSY